jgi:hypothetical protein
LIYRCVEAGLLNVQQFSTEWEKIIMADQVARNLFPPDVRNMLDQLMMQHLLAIGLEVRQYEPSFNHQQTANGYDAFMGDGSAIGGSPVIQNAQSIDDIYYTVGGKGYFIR